MYFSNIVSARSGETEDTTIVHLAVGWGAPQLKVGSFARSERVAKWNEGLHIAEQFTTGAALARGQLTEQSPSRQYGGNSQICQLLDIR